MILLIYCLGYYFLAGLAINVGYHRCMAHRSLHLKKWFERVLITMGLLAGTPIQWAGNHRYHHSYTDRVGDPHSPHQGGFWHAHVGWYLGTDNGWICFAYSLAGPLRTFYDGWHRPRSNQEHVALARDVAQDPYYRFISRKTPYLIANVLNVLILFGGVYLIAGWNGIEALWMMSIIVYNLGDAVNSFGHLHGNRPYKATHLARNNRLLAYLTLGEGWHANHHVFSRSARHGLLPHQFDWTWHVIRLLEKVGLASRIIVPEQKRIRQRLLGEHPPQHAVVQILSPSQSSNQR